MNKADVEFAVGEISTRGASTKDIIHRDQVHGDVQYDALSAALLNTNALQRLGRVYQLGYSHLVYRGGTHTRLSHVMGAAHMAGKIVDALRINYKQNRAARPRQHVAEPAGFLPCPTGSEADRWDVLRHLVTWGAMLHDLGHVPLGHTLEDEFEGIFKKHDDFASPRSLHLWGPGTEIYQLLTDASLYPPSFQRCPIFPTQVWQTVLLICFFKDSPEDVESDRPDFPQYLARTVQLAASKLKEKKKELQRDKDRKTKIDELQAEFNLHKKMTGMLTEAWHATRDQFRPFMSDIVANTICADYLDYVRRDPLNVGLDVLRDDRILSNFYVSNDAAGLRMALALLDRHGKTRLDVCTGVVEQVRQRYRFAESIYYHKTKVSASAMFAKAMTLIGKPPEVGSEQLSLFDKGRQLESLAKGLIRSHRRFVQLKHQFLPSALTHPEIGDDSLHLWLMQRGIDNIERLVQATSAQSKQGRGRSAAVLSQLRGIALVQAIVRRQLYKVSFSINAQQFGQLTKGASQDSVVEVRLRATLKRLREDKGLRERIEHKLADAVGWPADSILLYVPPRKSQAKGIETFAFDESGVVRLNKHRAVSEKVNELGRDYSDLWRILVLTHPMYKDSIIELSEVADILATELWTDFPRQDVDPRSDKKMEIAQTAEPVDLPNLHDEKIVKALREIAWFPYIRKDHRGAAESMSYISVGLPSNVNVDWELFNRTPVLTTLSEHTLADAEYAERAFLLQCLVREHGIKEQKAVSLIKDRFPKTDGVTIHIQERMVDEKIKPILRDGEIMSEAHRRDLLRAIKLQLVAAEIAGVRGVGTHQTRKSTRRTTVSRRRRQNHRDTGRLRRGQSKRKAG